ncbi:hypothetical protein FQN60_017365 [Etheostoma spectabile]|uniref:Uncharacterized protein n=1 Tax=Etheostoma spectabile TaxID=54343 RepID=A0A5J5DFD9_9PERO|nr:hypothetical protein FQN60_017365 [Etheostoma spectabile]
MSRAARPESPARSPGRSPGRRQEQPHGRVGSGTRDSGAGSARSKRHLEGVLKKYTNPLQGWQSRHCMTFDSKKKMSLSVAVLLSPALFAAEDNMDKICILPPRLVNELHLLLQVSLDPTPFLSLYPSLLLSLPSLSASPHQGSETRLHDQIADSRDRAEPLLQHTNTHKEGSKAKRPRRREHHRGGYFVLDPEVGQLQYYLNELSKSQRPPRGSLPLLGAMVVSSADFPYMFTIQSTTGDSYKLRALLSLFHQQVLLTHRPRREKRAEGQQKNLVNSIESLSPRGGPLSSLDEDLLLLKATSAATLSCLGECLSMLQHNVVQALNQNQNQNQNHTPSPSLPHSSAGLNQAAPTDRVRPWSQRCSSSVNQMEPGGLRSSSQNPTHSFSETQSPKDGSYSGRPGSGLNHIHSQSLGGEHADSSTGRSRSLSEKQVKPPPSSSSWPSSTQTHKDPSETKAECCDPLRTMVMLEPPRLAQLMQDHSVKLFQGSVGVSVWWNQTEEKWTQGLSLMFLCNKASPPRSSVPLPSPLSGTYCGSIVLGRLSGSLVSSRLSLSVSLS